MAMNGDSKTGGNVKEVVPFLNVSSMERSVRYYVEGLGFRMKHQWVVDGKLRWGAGVVVAGTGSDHPEAAGTDLDLVGVRRTLPRNGNRVGRDEFVE